MASAMPDIAIWGQCTLGAPRRLDDRADRRGTTSAASQDLCHRLVLGNLLCDVDGLIDGFHASSESSNEE